jgi:hypothetical protein
MMQESGRFAKKDAVALELDCRESTAARTRAVGSCY